MAWNLAGTFYENCSCDAICPCTWSNMAHQATNDNCRVALMFDIDSGSIDGLDVGGTAVVMIAQTPAMMPEGNWTVGLIISDDASAEQTEALGRVFSGAMGGPPAGLAPLIGNFVGIEHMPVSVTSEDNTHHVVVGDAVDYKTTKMMVGDDPVQLTNIVVHPGGPTLDVAQADEVTASAFGIEWSGESLSSFTNPFSWAA
jgi:hypothetical protein